MHRIFEICEPWRATRLEDEPPRDERAASSAAPWQRSRRVVGAARAEMSFSHPPYPMKLFVKLHAKVCELNSKWGLSRGYTPLSGSVVRGTNCTPESPGFESADKSIGARRGQFCVRSPRLAFGSPQVIEPATGERPLAA